MSDVVNKLLEDLEAYSAREFRVAFREYLTLLQADEMERRNSAACISRATLLDAETCTYGFEDTELKMRAEEQVTIVDLMTDVSFKSNVKALNTAKKQISFTKMKAVPSQISVLMAPFRYTDAIPESVKAVRERLTEYPMLSKLLRRDPELGGPASLDHVPKLNDSFMVIQGPPGTGKTYVGTRLVVDMIAAGKKVGIMAPSHRALNQFCQELEKAATDKKVEFFGAKAFSKERDRIDGKMFTNVRSSEVVKRITDWPVLAATVHQFARVPDGYFDYMVFDEAGQLSLCHVVATARCARNALFLGDQQQLPHVSQAKHPEGAGLSVLEHLLTGSAVVPPNLGVFLAHTRRMNRELTEFISELCYDGRLRSHVDAASKRFHLDPSPSDPLGPSSVVFHAVTHSGNEQQSVEEAEAVKRLTTRIFELAPETKVIVVTPFRAHENLIKEYVGDKVMVGTVDRFQGAEADVVIYTMATSDPDAMPRDAEFLLSVNRMNVAVSRAKKKAILICSPKLLETPPDTVEKMRLASALCFVKSFSERLISRHAFEYVVLDIETTGLNPSQSNVIEISGVKCRGQEILGEFDALVKPFVKMDEGALKAHGMTDEFIQEHGRPPAEVLKEFLAFIGDCGLVAHNGICFDFPFLANELKRWGLEPTANRLYDTLPLSRRYLRTTDGSYRLQSLCDTYQIVNERAHRALSDAKATTQVFLNILKDDSLPLAEELWSLSYEFRFDNILSLPPGMELLQEAMTANQDLCIEYESPAKGLRERWIRPRNLAIAHSGARSVRAICLEENIEKHFRLDRIKRLVGVRTQS